MDNISNQEYESGYRIQNSNDIDRLKARVATLENQVAALMRGTGICNCQNPRALHDRDCPVAIHSASGVTWGEAVAATGFKPVKGKPLRLEEGRRARAAKPKAAKKKAAR